MRKILLGLGTLTAVVVPVVAVVSCADNGKQWNENKTADMYRYNPKDNSKEKGFFTKGQWGQENSHDNDYKKYIGNNDYGHGILADKYFPTELVKHTISEAK